MFLSHEVIPSLIRNLAESQKHSYPTRTSCIELCDLGKGLYFSRLTDMSINSKRMDWMASWDGTGSNSVSGFVVVFNVLMNYEITFGICNRVLKLKGRR